MQVYAYLRASAWAWRACRMRACASSTARPAWLSVVWMALQLARRETTAACKDLVPSVKPSHTCCALFWHALLDDVLFDKASPYGARALCLDTWTSRNDTIAIHTEPIHKPPVRTCVWARPMSARSWPMPATALCSPSPSLSALPTSTCAACDMARA